MFSTEPSDAMDYINLLMYDFEYNQANATRNAKNVIKATAVLKDET